MTNKLPPLPEQAYGKNGFVYKQKFGVIVLCKDEQEHREVYETLKKQGYKCRVVRV